jgi:hypothetical protein
MFLWEEQSCPQGFLLLIPGYSGEVHGNQIYVELIDLDLLERSMNK